MVILIGIVVCFVAYRPVVGTDLSYQNADWGSFGAFFWGFGAMCFTLLNVIVFYHIEQRIYRKQFFDTYRVVIEKIIHDIKDNKALKLDFIDMTGVLGGISNVSAYNTSVKNQAAYLLSRIQNYQNKSDNDELASLVGELTAYQICLITNEHLDILEQNNGIADAQINKKVVEDHLLQTNLILDTIIHKNEDLIRKLKDSNESSKKIIMNNTRCM